MLFPLKKIDRGTAYPEFSRLQKELFMEPKKPVSLENFEDGVKAASPMPLGGLKREK